MTASVGAEGVSIEVPSGWDARVRTHTADAAAPEGARTASTSGLVVLHAGSLALPPAMGDTAPARSRP